MALVNGGGGGGLLALHGHEEIPKQEGQDGPGSLT